MTDIVKRHFRFLSYFMLVLCALSASLTLWAVRGAEAVHARQTYDEIYSIKKAFLKDTVQNMVRDIDRLRAFGAAAAEANLELLAAELRRLHAASPSSFPAAALRALSHQRYRESLLFRLEDAAANRVLYETPGGSAYSREFSFGSYRLYASVNGEWVDRRSKENAAVMIRDQVHQNGGYLWVNEVLNWKGGDDYAIRRVHPNMRETEGSYLSTNTRDIAGSLPYLKELEGVRDAGELFYTYYFKRPDSDRITEKITYATVYKDFDWIIAMGVYLEDVGTYVKAVEESSRSLTSRLLSVAVGSLVAFFAGGLLILSRMERRYLAQTSRAIREESNIDPLTRAFNRRMGDQYLTDAFNKFRRGSETSALLLFDVDDFKRVNDRYGHKAGDVVLQTISSCVMQCIRASDHLIRWGGEEFLAVCYGVHVRDLKPFAEKLRAAIELLDIDVGAVSADGPRVGVTVSFGAAWFLQEDEGPEEALIRADRALYRAKAAGKNCVRTQDPA